MTDDNDNPVGGCGRRGAWGTYLSRAHRRESLSVPLNAWFKAQVLDNKVVSIAYLQTDFSYYEYHGFFVSCLYPSKLVLCTTLVHSQEASTTI